MDEKAAQLQEKIRQLFDFEPYPSVPIDQSANEVGLLYLHNLVNAYYFRNQKVINPANKIILDIGCGTGYKALVLAQANPGSKVIGIDISEKSVELARQRFKYHGVENGEFHQIAIDALPNLGLEFDYINCDEVLYLVPEPISALKALKSVLKPDGIIRGNFHSSVERFYYFCAQEVFSILGLMDNSPEEMEIGMVIETMKALKDGVGIKSKTWTSIYDTEERKKDVLMNYLLQGDKGYTVGELFAALRAADLEFISMVNWWQWNLMDLFKEPDNLPIFLAMGLPQTSMEERLRLFELLHPIHRLLDFWCGHPNQGEPYVPVTEWTLADWQNLKVHLHPQLRTLETKAELVKCITQLQPFEISKRLPLIGQASSVDSTVAACLLPLWESAQRMPSLVARWHALRPVHLLSGEPTTEQEAFDTVKQVLTGLERLGYVLLERLL